MAVTRKRSGLGRGLSSLLGEDIYLTEELQHSYRMQEIEIDSLAPSVYQPRRSIDQDKIDELAVSVRSKGVLQPILARRKEEERDQYEIIAGERRWRAARQVGLKKIPAIILSLSDLEIVEIGLIENLQREELKPLEEARVYERLVKEFRHTHEDISLSVGRSRSYISNMLRLLALPEEIQHMLNAEQLTIGHARALLGSKNAVILAQKVLKYSLSVRDTEALIRKEKKSKKPVSVKKPRNVIVMEEGFSQALGLKTTVRPMKKGGCVTIRYGNQEELNALFSLLKGNKG